MAYNGSGTFSRIYNWVTDQSNSIPITASRMDAEQNGIATGLSTAITKDGQTTITANIPFSTKKITGLGDGSARTDSIALGQVQDGTYTTLGTAGGSADTYTASPSPAITAYATGSRYIIKIQADNTTASTLNISAVGAKDIKKYDGAGAKVALIAGDVQQDEYYDIFYDGTDVIVLNPGRPENITTAKDIVAGEDLTVTKEFNAVEQTATIATGAVAYGGMFMAIDTESAASTDDLDTISGGTKGNIVIIKSAGDARDVVLKHGTGNLFLPNSLDITLSDAAGRITLQYNGSNWLQLSRTLTNDFLSSKSSSGYTYLPNGLIFQWGIGSVTGDGNTALSLPITFPTAALQGVACQGYSFIATSDAGCGITAISTTQVTIRNGALTGNQRYFVIGY